MGFFDPHAVSLLFRRPRVGLLLNVAIIVSDIIVNSFVQHGALLVLSSAFQGLQAQTAFLGFVLGIRVSVR
ncbi:Hypothetical protein Deide_1p00918 (plasmid) [Deinococcus deserti VCD115]|uniref:Uncharacterized protein n=1 Tax=Deinococcus deserti (strain DSM 17065 / CIP 109153 / LMG 22923 / VCD115) TaxID=546414 RepID=C1D264_DEIDV|nr:Hypothetical protein Deide_1p00918 [Deinococcus deserti VCD115]